jgi:hypothetical protein
MHIKTYAGTQYFEGQFSRTVETWKPYLCVVVMRIFSPLISLVLAEPCGYNLAIKT